MNSATTIFHYSLLLHNTNNLLLCFINVNGFPALCYLFVLLMIAYLCELYVELVLRRQLRISYIVLRGNPGSGKRTLDRVTYT